MSLSLVQKEDNNSISVFTQAGTLLNQHNLTHTHTHKGFCFLACVKGTDRTERWPHAVSDFKTSFMIHHWPLIESKDAFFMTADINCFSEPVLLPHSPVIPILIHQEFIWMV